jgi:hypothetical protein
VRHAWLIALAVAPGSSMAGQRIVAPVLAGLSPSSAIVGSAPVQLRLKGSGFARGSVVRWKGVDRPTTYVSASELVTDLTAADFALVGSSSVTVFNAVAGGSTSNALTFTVGNPLPVLTGISPWQTSR